MKHYILFLLFAFCQSYAQETINNKSLNELMTENFSHQQAEIQVSYKKSSIPKAFKKALKEKFGDFRIANPDKNFRSTDVKHNPLLPSKQLVFTIKKDNFYGIVFINGGRGKSTYFAFSEILSGKEINYQVFYIKSIEKPDELYKLIEKGDLNPVDW